jgi:hypothetical protein
MLIDDIKVSLSKESNSSIDNLLTIYIRQGVTRVTNYMNFPDVPITDPVTPPVDVATTYADALIEYVTLCYHKKGNEGVKQASQGSRGVTYVDGLPDSVKDLLPSPFIRMMGVRRCSTTT